MNHCGEQDIKFRILYDKGFKQAPYSVQMSYNCEKWFYHPHNIRGMTLEECEKRLRDYESNVAKYQPPVVVKEFKL